MPWKPRKEIIQSPTTEFRVELFWFSVVMVSALRYGVFSQAVKGCSSVSWSLPEGFLDSSRVLGDNGKATLLCMIMLVSTV